jgi:hypothetical protein
MIIDERLLKLAARDYGEEAFQIFGKFAYNPEVNGTQEDIWSQGGTLTRLSSAATASIVSTSANDTAAGTGARTMLIDGVDNNWNRITETVTLNGTTPVITTKSFLRINRMYITSSGTGQTNAGNITATITATIQASIVAGAGQTEKSQYAVPMGYRFTIAYWNVNSGANSDFEAFLLTNHNNEGWRIRRRLYFTNEDVQISIFSVTVDEKTDIKVTARSLTGTGKPLSTDYIGYLLKKHS